ncbi:MAG: hypothetical protein MJ181_08705 [Treponema sp.]|nr:hypothetical protein [Treponema sp.]
MTEDKISQFEIILGNEEIILSGISEIQKELRLSVQKKDWGTLTNLINRMNEASDAFVKIDSERDEIQSEMTSAEVAKYSRRLLVLRSKLAQSKIENKVLTDYISITRGFINGVLDKASTKTYSRYGQIVQKQPVSVLVSADL